VRFVSKMGLDDMQTKLQNSCLTHRKRRIWKYMKRGAKRAKNENWHPYFIFHGVFIANDNSRTHIWFEMVERRIKYHTSDAGYGYKVRFYQCH